MRRREVYRILEKNKKQDKDQKDNNHTVKPIKTRYYHRFYIKNRVKVTKN